MNIIVAADKNWAIGKDNKRQRVILLLWAERPWRAFHKVSPCKNG